MNLRDYSDDLANIGSVLLEFSKKYNSHIALELSSKIEDIAEELKAFSDSIEDTKQVFIVGIQAKSKTATESIEKAVVYALWRQFKDDTIEVKLTKNDSVSKVRKNLTFEIVAPLNISRDEMFEAVISATKRIPETEALGIGEVLKNLT